MANKQNTSVLDTYLVQFALLLHEIVISSLTVALPSAESEAWREDLLDGVYSSVERLSCNSAYKVAFHIIAIEIRGFRDGCLTRFEVNSDLRRRSPGEESVIWVLHALPYWVFLMMILVVVPMSALGTVSAFVAALFIVSIFSIVCCAALLVTVLAIAGEAFILLSSMAVTMLATILPIASEIAAHATYSAYWLVTSAPVLFWLTFTGLASLAAVSIFHPSDEQRSPHQVGYRDYRDGWLGPV